MTGLEILSMELLQEPLLKKYLTPGYVQDVRQQRHFSLKREINADLIFSDTNFLMPGEWKNLFLFQIISRVLWALLIITGKIRSGPSSPVLLTRVDTLCMRYSDEPGQSTSAGFFPARYYSSPGCERTRGIRG